MVAHQVQVKSKTRRSQGSGWVVSEGFARVSSQSPWFAWYECDAGSPSLKILNFMLLQGYVATLWCNFCFRLRSKTNKPVSRPFEKKHSLVRANREQRTNIWSYNKKNENGEESGTRTTSLIIAADTRTRKRTHRTNFVHTTAVFIVILRTE